MVSIHDVIFGAVAVTIGGVAAYRAATGSGDGGQGLLIELFGEDTPETGSAPPPSAKSPVGRLTADVAGTLNGSSSGGSSGGSSSGSSGTLVHGPGGGSYRFDPDVIANPPWTGGGGGELKN